MSIKSEKNKSLYFSLIYSFFDACPFFKFIQVSGHFLIILLEDLLLTFLEAGVLTINSLSLYFVFGFWRSFISLLRKLNFTGYRIHVWCFFPKFKYFTIFSCLHSIWQEVSYHSYHCSSINKAFYSLGPFKIFFVFSFLHLNKICLYMFVSWYLSYLSLF